MCFSINLAHLLDGDLTDTQAAEQGAKTYRLASLTPDSCVKLSETLCEIVDNLLKGNLYLLRC